jgi:hypothetical protein
MRNLYLIFLLPFFLVCKEGISQRKLIKRVNGIVRISNPSENLPPDPYFGCTGIIYSKWRTNSAAFVNNMSNTTDWHDYADVIANTVGTFTLVERRYTALNNTSYLCSGTTHVETVWEVIIENPPTKSGTGALPVFCEDEIPNNSLSLSPLVQYPGHLSNINWTLSHIGLFSPIVNNYSADARLSFQSAGYGVNPLKANIPYVNDPTFALIWTVDYNGLKKREFSFTPNHELETGEKIEIRRTNYIYSDILGNVEWEFGDGFKSPNLETSHNYYEPGLKTLTLKLNTASCSFSRQFENVFYVKDYEVITSEPLKEYRLSLYPNPVKSEIRIEGISGNYQWKLVDVFGNEIDSSFGTNQEKVLIINIEKYALTPGIYIFKINEFTKKIIKQ